MPIRIVRGLDIPIAGAPDQVVGAAPEVTSVALLGGDYPGLRPAMRVAEGDRVRLGQALFADRRRPRIVFTAPGAGTVAAINRGARRALQSVVLRLDGDAAESFPSWPREALDGLRHDQIVDLLLQSGLWTALRSRPFGGVADPDTTPASIFVTAIDTNPLAADPAVVIRDAAEAFDDGLRVVTRLADAPVHLCTAPRAGLDSIDGVAVHEFSGPHPAGLVGTHIHLLDPVAGGRFVWHLDYQDAIAIGRLFTTGRLPVERIVSLAGPMVRQPRLIRARRGAGTDELTNGGLTGGPVRVISGSVLSGHRATGPLAYLGRYHNQISAIPEGGGPAGARFSAHRPGSTPPRRRYVLGTARHGRPTAMLPLGGYERVVPLDMLATPLLRALLVGDVETARALGCTELAEEDLALCGFVCPGKQDYGAALRTALRQIEGEAG